jgi:hypothetical protein
MTRASRHVGRSKPQRGVPETYVGEIVAKVIGAITGRFVARRFRDNPER